MEKISYILIAFMSTFLVSMIYVILDEQEHSKLIEFSLMCLAMLSIVVISKAVSKI